MKKALFSTILSNTACLLIASNMALATPPKAIGKSSNANPKTNQFWWPENLDLSTLRDHDPRSNPYGENFNYAEEFKKLDLDTLKADINTLLTTSQDWWPSDYGNYGPLFIRMAWHSAGTYRTLDGRGGGEGGQQRFNPLNSWPDNANLDKARRLLWPIKKKYGRQISWGDLMILAGTVAMENMGFETYGFAGGRADDWEPDVVYWGPELKMLGSDRRDSKGNLQGDLAAIHMGLIYVNPEGPMGKPDPAGSAKDVRLSFSRMAMDDEETVALIAGGHTFGKMHGAHKVSCVEKEPGAAPIEEQGLGWKNNCNKGHSEDTFTSGLEGAWTQDPVHFTTNLYLQNLLNLDWKITHTPAGAVQWIPVDDKNPKNRTPDAHIKGKTNPVVMTTADLALKFDPTYNKIARKFLENPEEFKKAFGRAWFKLTHRDMGPVSRYLGKHVPSEQLIWQDPLPKADYKTISKNDVKNLKKKILESNLTISELVRTAWASASSFQASNVRGGANGARIALLPQKNWEVNNPQELDKVLKTLKEIQSEFNNSFSNKLFGEKVSLADLIVLGGAAAIEKSAKDAGFDVKVPFAPGRVDALQEQTDINLFNKLEPKADAFRNYFNQQKSETSPTEMMVDRADQLTLTVPEMVVLLGGMRALGANFDDSNIGILTSKAGTLTNEFFVNLMDSPSIKWKKSAKSKDVYEGFDTKTDELKYQASSVDLILGSNSELRAVAEVYASDDAKEKFVNDFIKAWVKVMRLDRFDLNSNNNK